MPRGAASRWCRGRGSRNQGQVLRHWHRAMCAAHAQHVCMHAPAGGAEGACWRERVLLSETPLAGRAAGGGGPHGVLSRARHLRGGARAQAEGEVRSASRNSCGWLGGDCDCAWPGCRPGEAGIAGQRNAAWQQQQQQSADRQAAALPAHQLPHWLLLHEAQLTGAVLQAGAEHLAVAPAAVHRGERVVCSQAPHAVRVQLQRLQDRGKRGAGSSIAAGGEVRMVQRLQL